MNPQKVKISELPIEAQKVLGNVKKPMFKYDHDNYAIPTGTIIQVRSHGQPPVYKMEGVTTDLSQKELEQRFYQQMLK